MPPKTLPENDTDGNGWETAEIPSLNSLFSVLSDETRRETLVILRAKNGPVSLADLVAEFGGTRDETRLSLVHVHLPMLDATGLVNWDRAQETVELDPVPEAYQGLLETVERNMR